MNRRELLIAVAVIGDGGVALVGCGGSSGQGGTAQDLAWTVYPHPVLSVGVAYELGATLPAGVKPGGRFGVDPSGTPLPTGVLLSTAGVLSVTSAAAPGDINGVVFAYEEPDS